MVAERIYRLPLTDLGRIRITCKACNVSSEAATPGDLSAAIDPGTCPHCQVRLYETQGGRDDPLAQIDNALQRLRDLESTVLVEFVIPDPDKIDPTMYGRSKN